MVLSGPLAGCLVTEEITFGDELDVPPIILDAPGTKAPIGQHLWLDKQAAPSWSIFVKVREENREQLLKAHYRVVTRDEETPTFEPVKLPAQDGALLRDLELRIKSESLLDGECHHLELAVSSAFFDATKPAFFDAVPPGRESEIAYASWWIWEGPGTMLATASDKARLAETCGALEGLLAPPVVLEVQP